jgi:succinylglutamate desuccinylase
MADHIAPLKSVADRLAEASAEGIPGVLKIESSNPGPSVAILAGTHGNEPVGFAAFDYLLSDLTLNAGSLYFILSNPKAVQWYFDAECADGRESSRYIDRNMNRLRAESVHPFAAHYEFRRAAQLMPIIEKVDGILDLHSTSSDAPPMLICVDDDSSQLVQDALFPFSHIIGEIHQHLSGQFMIEFATSARLKILAECGQHECLYASQNAIDISLAFLHAMGLVEDYLPRQKERELHYYRTKQAVFLPEKCGTFRLNRLLEPFEYLEKGQILATSETGAEAHCPDSGYAIMCPETFNQLDCSEALLFLCDRD